MMASPNSLKQLAAKARMAPSARVIPLRRTYMAWLYECSTYDEGWTAYPIEAFDHDEAVEIASQRFAGTQGFWTMEVDKEPIR